MNSSVLSILVSFSILVQDGEASENLIGTDIHDCIKCLCHTSTGCWSRINCAKYTISRNKWIKVGSPVVEADDDPNKEESYTKCMENENCIVNTIYKHVKSFGDVDCNCDGKHDCKDWFALYLYGNKCLNPVFGKGYAIRFNECAKEAKAEEMKEEEGFSGCELTIIPK